MPQPNVILIMTDQQRADAVGYEGSVCRTPAIDALARDGVVFSNAFVQCPVCMASRAAIHTGRYPRALRVPSMGILPPQEITIAETLKRAGYATGMFGKLHFTPQSHTLRSLGCDTPLDVSHFLAPAGIDTPWNRAAAEDPAKRNYGFDESVGLEDTLWGHWFNWLRDVSPEHEAHARAENWGGNTTPRYGDSPPATRMFHPTVADFFDSHIPAELSASRFIVERTIDFIRRNAAKPFFVHCSFVDPHHPFNAPSPHNRMYDPDAMETPPPEDPAFSPSPLRGAAVEQYNRMRAFPDELWRWVRGNYFGMISNIDDCIGRLLAELERLGVRDNTVIIFTADHGEFAGGHRLLYKGTLLYDDLMRVPLLVNWPAAPQAVRSGTVVTELVQEIDIYPTLMALLGLPIHDGVQGHNLTPLLAGAAVPGAAQPPYGELPPRGIPGAARPVHVAAPGYDRVFCELDDLPAAAVIASVAVRTKEWKLNYFPHTGRGMLFDLRNDPRERRNLYDDPGYLARRAELMGELVDMYDVMKDPLPHRLTQA